MSTSAQGDALPSSSGRVRMQRHQRWTGFGLGSEAERVEAEAFESGLFGEARESDPPLWLSYARRLPVTYSRQQQPMSSTIKGVVVHTTNHSRGAETLERFQRDWPGQRGQSAHFAIDRAGNIGQYRSTRQVAWHIHTPSPHYFGIEHIAKLDQELTEAQFESSVRLVGDLAAMFGFPAQAFSSGRGIGIHVDFAYTGCGRSVFWSGKQRGRTDVYRRLVDRARFYSQFGF